MNPNAYRRTLYVGNIDETANEEIVRAAFIPFGEIVSIDLPVDPRTSKTKQTEIFQNRLNKLLILGKARNFAFVEFEEVGDADAALENMANSELLGRVISCTIAKPSTIVGAKGKSVWALDEEMNTITAGTVTQTTVNNSNNIESKQSNKKEENLPPGFVRCKGCGGWGKFLVGENGFCDHCNSTNNQIQLPSSQK